MMQRRLLTRTLHVSKGNGHTSTLPTAAGRDTHMQSQSQWFPSSSLYVSMPSSSTILSPAASTRVRSYTTASPLIKCQPLSLSNSILNEECGARSFYTGTCTSSTSISSTSLPTLSNVNTSCTSSNNNIITNSIDHRGRHHQQYQRTTTRSKVFVSRHNQSLNITSNQISDYCSHHGIHETDLRVTNTHVVLRECPFCTKPTNDKADNMFKIYVKIGGGAYFCHRCGCKGSWYDFKAKLGGYEVTDSMGRSQMQGGGGGFGGGNMRNGPGNQQPPSSYQNQNNYGNQNNNGGYNNNNYGAQGGNSNFRGGGGRGGGNSAPRPLPMPSQRLQAAYITNLQETPNGEGASGEAMEYLTETRGLTKQTLRKYGVGLGSYNFPSNEPGQHGKYVRADCITFPWIMRGEEINVQEKLRDSSYNWKVQVKDNKNKEADSSNTNEGGDSDSEIDGEGESVNNNGDELGPFVTRRLKARAIHNKSWQRLDPPGGGWGLFGWHTVPHDATEIIVTEGEYDAMAVHQATGRPAVSLPNGCRSLPVEVLPMLERFETIYLWMDNDGPGREGAEQFAKKIGVNRCLIVQPDASVEGKTAPKDANEALLQGMDLDAIVKSSAVLPHERILTFADIRTEVLHEMLNPEKYSGVKVPSLPQFTDILKGFRRGELTVLTGPTGSGKTTFLGQLSLDFAEQGVNTMWGSFEIKNTRLMHKLLQQYSRGPLPEDKLQKAEALEVLADRFENLPLYFMKYHGGSDIDDVLDAMEYSAYVHDVQHIILDNMQFMISRNSPKYNGSFDKFEIQDIAIEKFRKFATSKNIHVTLVCHPRKEEEGMKLGMSSVYGSAKATQEADNVIILQKDPTNPDRKYIEVKKNRYDGTLGMSPLHFQMDSKRYSESPSQQLPPMGQKSRPAASPQRVPATGGNRSFVSAAVTTPKAIDNGDARRKRIAENSSKMSQLSSILKKE